MDGIEQPLWQINIKDKDNRANAKGTLVELLRVCKKGYKRRSSNWEARKLSIASYLLCDYGPLESWITSHDDGHDDCYVCHEEQQKMHRYRYRILLHQLEWGRGKIMFLMAEVISLHKPQNPNPLNT